MSGCGEYLSGLISLQSNTSIKKRNLTFTKKKENILNKLLLFSYAYPGFTVDHLLPEKQSVNISDTRGLPCVTCISFQNQHCMLVGNHIKLYLFSWCNFSPVWVCTVHTHHHHHHQFTALSTKCVGQDKLKAHSEKIEQIFTFRSWVLSSRSD